MPNTISRIIYQRHEWWRKIVIVRHSVYSNLIRRDLRHLIRPARMLVVYLYLLAMDLSYILSPFLTVVVIVVVAAGNGGGTTAATTATTTATAATTATATATATAVGVVCFKTATRQRVGDPILFCYWICEWLAWGPQGYRSDSKVLYTEAISLSTVDWNERYRLATFQSYSRWLTISSSLDAIIFPIWFCFVLCFHCLVIWNDSIFLIQVLLSSLRNRCSTQWPTPSKTKLRTIRIY